jgi:hypothetical protein
MEITCRLIKINIRIRNKLLIAVELWLCLEM